MKTYSGDKAGSQIEPILWHASRSVWLCSPWIGKDYTKRLLEMATNGIDVRIITTNDELNLPALEHIKAAGNTRLSHIIIDIQNEEERKFIHSKIYVIDSSFAVTGSANFTYSGMNTNIENLNIFEDEEEVRKVEYDFMKLWLKFEQKKMEIEKLSKINEDLFKIKNALPIQRSAPKIWEKQTATLTFHPYYRIEYLFKTASKIATEKLPNRGVVVIDATNMEIQDELITHEFQTIPIKDQYSIPKTDYTILNNQPKIAISYEKAHELFTEHIVAKYSQKLHYNFGLSSETFTAYQHNFTILSNNLAYLPIWQVRESHESQNEQLYLGGSGTLWAMAALCASCGSPVNKSGIIACSSCLKYFCKNCVVDKGRFLKAKYCKKCASIL